MTFGVSVIPLSDGPTPTGTIQYQIDGVNFGSAVPLAAGATASGPDYSLSVGAHTITAIYSGDSTYPASQVTASQTVESPSQVAGHVYMVTSLGDTGAGSGTTGDLRYAITQADANPGSVIDFSVTGVVQLTQALPAISAAMTINGPGPSLLTVKGGGPSSNFSVFGVSSAVKATISGLTVTGGNSTDNGGGIYNGGYLNLADCVITGNPAVVHGGGIENYDGRQPVSLTVNDCTIAANSANLGAGVAALFGVAVNLVDSIISGNSAGAFGGGIIVGSAATLAAYNSSISQNTSAESGGGIEGGGRQ